MEDKVLEEEEGKGIPLESLEAACRAYLKAQSEWGITRTKLSLSAYNQAREYLKGIAQRAEMEKWQVSAVLEEYGLSYKKVINWR